METDQTAIQTLQQSDLELAEASALAAPKEAAVASIRHTVDGLNKAQWVAAQPLDEDRHAVAERGAKLGFNLNADHVSAIRADAKARRGAFAKRRSPPPKPPSPAVLFVRRFPLTTKPREIVAAAKKAGVKLDDVKIRNIRHYDKSQGRANLYPKDGAQLALPAEGATAVAPRRGRPPGVPNRPKEESKQSVAAPSTDTEKRFVELVAELGTPRAAQLVEAVHIGWQQYIQSMTRG